MTETGRERAEGSSRLRVAVLVSGEGTTMTALAERSRAHGAPFQVVLVASDRPGAAALERARSLGIPTIVLPLLPRLKDPPAPEGLPAASALPPRDGGEGMYGSHVHEAVLRAGERETGATVHLVTESLDAGPVIAQARIPVLTGDDPASLAARLRPVEHRLLIQVVEDFARGRLPLPFSTPPGEPPGGSGG